MSGGWIIGPAFISAPDSASPQGSIARKRLADHLQRVVCEIERKDANRQPLGADGDGNLERPVLARQPGQRAGFGKRYFGAVGCVAHGRGEDHRTKGGRRQEYHLTVTQMRGEMVGNVDLRERRCRTQDQLGAGDSRTDICGDQRDLNIVSAIDILDE